MEQFTFYEIYSDVICNTDDVNAGKLINRICAYEFENAEQSDEMDDKERFYWGNISEILSEVKELESAGKTPKRYNKIRHFTFYRNYYNALKLLNVRKSGEFIKAICAYMFEGTEPNFKDKTMQSYFSLCKMKMDLSKQRKSSGKVGGAVNRNRTETTDDTKPTDAPTSENNRKSGTSEMTVADFIKRHPMVTGELFGVYERYNTELNWRDVAEKYEADEEFSPLTKLHEIVKLYLKKYGKTGSKSNCGMVAKAAKFVAG